MLEKEDEIKSIVNQSTSFHIKSFLFQLSFSVVLVVHLQKGSLGGSFRKYLVGHAAALTAMASIRERLNVEQEKCDDMLELATAFDCPREMGENVAVLLV